FRGSISTGKAAKVCPIVHAAHDETKDEEHDCPGFRLFSDDPAACASPVVNQCAEQTENRGRCADGVACAADKRYKAERHTEDGTCREARDPRNCVNDDHTTCAVHLGRGWRELSNPHHVEKDVQDASVQPSGT